MTEPELPGHLTALLRHFTDLRDGHHGGGVTRGEKEAIFASSVPLLDPFARQALDEVNAALLLGSGTVTSSGLVTDTHAGQVAQWSLSWAEQRQAGIQPVVLSAFYGSGFHHPHLRGGTLGDWPLNVFSTRDAQDQLPTLRAIASADLHNLVFQADFGIIPALRSTAARG